MMYRCLILSCLLFAFCCPVVSALPTKDILRRVQQCDADVSSMRSSGVSVKALMAENKNRRCLRKILTESDYGMALARSKKSSDLHVTYSSFKTKLLKTVDNIESIYYSIYCHSNARRACSDTNLIKAKRQANNFFKKVLLMMAQPQS